LCPPELIHDKCWTCQRKIRVRIRMIAHFVRAGTYCASQLRCPLDILAALKKGRGHVVPGKEIQYPGCRRSGPIIEGECNGASSRLAPPHGWAEYLGRTAANRPRHAPHSC
jgi:hypothetical protein